MSTITKEVYRVSERDLDLWLAPITEFGGDLEEIELVYETANTSDPMLLIQVAWNDDPVPTAAPRKE